jgi:hypothetical protein
MSIHLKSKKRKTIRVLTSAEKFEGFDGIAIVYVSKNAFKSSRYIHSDTWLDERDVVKREQIVFKPRGYSSYAYRG